MSIYYVGTAVFHKMSHLKLKNANGNMQSWLCKRK